MVIRILAVVVAVFLVEVALVAWFCWALYNVGYTSGALNFEQACTLTAPLCVASLIGIFGGNS